MAMYDVTIKGTGGYESTVVYEADNVSHAILIAGVHWAFNQLEGAEAGQLLEMFSPGFFDRVVPRLIQTMRDDHSVEVVEVQHG